MQVVVASQPSAPGAPQVVRIEDAAPNAQALYEAARARSNEIRNQISRLRSERTDFARSLRTGERTGADKAGLELRVTNLDARIAELDKQAAVADAEVARLAGIPGAVVEPPRPIRRGPEPELIIVPFVLMAAVMLPMAIAMARRIWRGTPKRGEGSTDAATAERLARIEQAVDAIAIEVERVSEGQRFLTRVMSEQGRAIGAGAAEPVEIRAREGVAVPRR